MIPDATPSAEAANARLRPHRLWTSPYNFSKEETAFRLQRRLREFQEELADADQRLHVSLDNIGGFSTFADFFFDGLIADWVVQSKAEKASRACDSAIRQVSSALTECERQLSQVEREVEQVASERQKFVEGA